MITNIDKTIESAEGRATMKDKEKFAGFKQEVIEENEKKYGNEIREKYGDQTVDRSNQKVLNMSQEQYDEVTRLSNEVMEVLQKAFKTGDPGSPLAQQAADLHRQWLSYFWDGYTKEAHLGVTQMYVDDQRFTAYYDQEQPGTAEFLRDAVKIYTEF
ncbi:hypothetical protein N752_30890 [Desulforamulus aquiferis]|nr:hypothetical protein N752_30890 [Desulforamulus aquiferis]